MKAKTTQACPCGSGKNYAACCEPYIAGTSNAPTAETLMRSRYTAYALMDETYLQKTWHPSTCPDPLICQEVNWIGLTVLAHHQEATTATVEFVAKYKMNGRAEKMHELSRFVLEEGQWLYVEGDFLND